MAPPRASKRGEYGAGHECNKGQTAGQKTEYALHKINQALEVLAALSR